MSSHYVILLTNNHYTATMRSGIRVDVVVDWKDSGGHLQRLYDSTFKLEGVLKRERFVGEKMIRLKVLESS